jgi:hypothetical protein
MTLAEWRLLWFVARAATMERVRLDAMLYGSGFVGVDGWRLDPCDVVITGARAPLSRLAQRYPGTRGNPMQFRKRDFDGKRRPFPPLPAGHFFCRACGTIRAEALRSASGKRDHCRQCATASQAKSRAAIAAKGLTKPRSTKSQSSTAI